MKKHLKWLLSGLFAMAFLVMPAFQSTALSVIKENPLSRTTLPTPTGGEKPPSTGPVVSGEKPQQQTAQTNVSKGLQNLQRVVKKYRRPRFHW